MNRDQADEALMLRFRDGDLRAFDDLYARYKGPLYRYLRRQCGSADAAEELFQDIWLNLIKARHSYSVKASFKTYLYRVAHNRVVDFYRRSSRRMGIGCGDAGATDLETLPAAAHEQPDRQEERRRLAERLLQLLAELPETQREAFLLREEAGLSLDAIAEITGVSRETAKSRLRYAIAKLRQGLEVIS